MSTEEMARGFIQIDVWKERIPIVLTKKLDSLDQDTYVDINVIFFFFALRGFFGVLLSFSFFWGWEEGCQMMVQPKTPSCAQ